MLTLLHESLSEIQSRLGDPGEWDSIVIDKRKPHTNRLIAKTPVNGQRVCLHEFSVCDENEARPHPHPWPGAFLMLRGSYNMWIGTAPHRTTLPMVMERILFNTGSAYEIMNPMTFHCVQPLEPCYTVMINGAPWAPEVVHAAAPTTRGKGLLSMNEMDKIKLLIKFEQLFTVRQRGYQW